MRMGHLVAALLLVPLAAFLLYETTRFRMPLESHDVGPRLFPQVILSIVVVAILALALQSWLRRPDLNVRFQNSGQVVGAVLLAGLTVALLSILGFLIVMPLYLIGAMLLLGNRKWRAILAVAVGFTLVTYGLFGLLLSVPLPMGFLANL